MKIITWNCNMAFRKKADYILRHHPDILVVPECENRDRLIFQDNINHPTDILWFGENQNKGLGIFSYSNFKFKLLDTYNPALRMVIPIAVSDGIFDFTLYAIWANNPTDRDGRYITQIWKAVNHYNTITNKKTILIGDFNSNTIWDRPRREGNHSAVVSLLEKKEIFSVYHKHFNQAQGREQHATLYMYRQKEKSYHIDYCFASADMLEHLKSVEVGDYTCWTKYSDHVPLIVTFDPAIRLLDAKPGL